MNKEKVINGVKLALNTIAGLGISFLCSALAGNVAGTSNSGAIKKACMAIGGAVIGGMVANQAEKYINGEVDNFVVKFQEVMAVINDASVDKEKAEETT